MKMYRDITIKKRLGQNFLRDQSVLTKISAFVQEAQPEAIVEIGSGTGELTDYLIPFNLNLTLIEIDPALINHLQHKYQQCPTVKILEADARKIEFTQLLDKDAKNVVVGNLPYVSAINIMKQLNPARHLIAQIIVMLQKEVAHKISASVGQRAYSALSLFFNYQYQTAIKLEVSKDSFFPTPKVDSTVIVLEPSSDQRLIPRLEEKLFHRLVHAAFLNRRKKIINSLQNSQYCGYSRTKMTTVLEEVAISPDTRPDQISLEQYTQLAALLLKQTNGED
ncbi:16S rRNA (adenine(1518)-N(6)/adenine(1519)-N(6))-dimethyltransferase RsmA [candidate division CSSED10-310 bacterium]|uniref:16S rRNA (Adenine(1518)-N(6)/adenine(1519)-N(6))-dimethyltransferase RsmA n=1 Tax=candidate division CSSED10-310 bacterium TaxID=2855610 RepID=A0ABV6Z312_UNCC1